MAQTERLTLGVEADLAEDIRTAIGAGDYSSIDDVVREALEQWRERRAEQAAVFATLQAEVAIGLADAKAGRVTDFSTDRVVEQGRALLAVRSHSG